MAPIFGQFQANFRFSGALLMSYEIENLLKNRNLVYFMTESTISNRWAVAAP